MKNSTLDSIILELQNLRTGLDSELNEEQKAVLEDSINFLIQLRDGKLIIEGIPNEEFIKVFKRIAEVALKGILEHAAFELLLKAFETML